MRQDHSHRKNWQLQTYVINGKSYSSTQKIADTYKVKRDRVLHWINKPTPAPCGYRIRVIKNVKEGGLR